MREHGWVIVCPRNSVVDTDDYRDDFRREGFRLTRHAYGHGSRRL
jgi:hypothetical protein